MDGITDWYMIVFYFGGYALATFQILAVCYWGETVSQDSMGVALAAYDAYSVETNLQLQKGLLLIMSSSQKPVQFTIGKLGALSMDTFVKVMKLNRYLYNVVPLSEIFENEFVHIYANQYHHCRLCGALCYAYDCDYKHRFKTSCVRKHRF